MKRSLAIVAILLLAIVSITGQTRRSRFDPSGAFWLKEKPPAEFSDFSGINLNMRHLRRLPTSGLQLNDGTSFRFRTITVKQNNFTFQTVALRGVSYSFAGRFLKGGDFAATWMDDETPVLEGTLTKFKAGKKVAEAKLKFVYFGGT